MSTAAVYLEPDDGDLDPEGDAPCPSIALRRGEAEGWLDLVLGDRAGHVAVACTAGETR